MKFVSIRKQINWANLFNVSVSIAVPKYALKNIRTDNVNKENKKPINGTVKSVKKVEKVTPQPPKMKGVSVPRKPANIEAAFEQFNTADLEADIEVMKANFPNNHLVWLKSVSLSRASSSPLECFVE